VVQISALRTVISTELFRGFPQSPSKMMGQYLKLGHDRFLPHPFQFIIHISPPSSESLKSVVK
jgi:hypothetical protein